MGVRSAARRRCAASRSSARARGAPRWRSRSRAPAPRCSSAAAPSEQARTLLRRPRERALPARRHAVPDAVHVARAGALDLGEADLVCLAVPTRDLPVAMARDRRPPRRAGRPARVLEGPRPADRRRCRPRSSPSAPAAAPSPASAGPRTPPTRSSTAPRSSSPAATPRCARSCAACSPTRASTSRPPRTSSASSSRASRRTPRCSPPRPRRSPGRTPRAPPRARSSPRSPRTPARSARGPRPSPASPAPGTSSPRSSPRAAATAAPASCSPAACPQREIRPAIGQIAEALDAVPLLVTALERAGVRAPATRALAAVVTGEGSATAFADEVTSRAASSAPGSSDGDRGRLAMRGQGRARPALHGALQGAPARRLLVRYYRVGNHHDAEDLTEQTFLQAYRHFERALRSPTGRPLRPWLIRIAHNLAANLYRDRSRKPQTADRRRAEPEGDAHDGGSRRGPRRAARDPRGRAAAAGRPPRGADHALRARAWTTTRSRARSAAPTARPRC